MSVCHSTQSIKALSTYLAVAIALAMTCLFPANAHAQGLPNIQWLQCAFDPINQAAYSPDGKTIAVAQSQPTNTSGDGTPILLFNVSAGKSRIINTNVNPVLAIKFSPDGTIIADCGTNGSAPVLELWNVASGSLIRSLKTTATSSLNSVAFSPDGKTLADGGQSGSAGVIELWNLSTGKLIRSLKTAATNVKSVVFSPDGKTLAAGGNAVELWNVANGTLTRTLKTGSAINTVAFSPDGNTLADGGSVLELWNPTTGQLLNSLNTVASYINSVAFSTNGKSLAAGGSDLEWWNISTSRRISLSTANSGVNTVAFSPDGTTLMDGGQHTNNGGGLLEFWDSQTGTLINMFGNPGPWVTSVAISPDSTLLAAGGYSYNLQLLSAPNGALLGALPTGINQVNSVVFSPDGKTLVVGGYPSDVELWNMSTQAKIRSLNTAATGSVCSVAFSPDGKTVADAGYSTDSTGSPSADVVELWNSSTGNLIHSLNTAANASGCNVAFSPDGTMLAVGGQNGNSSGVLELWNVSTGKLIKSLNTSLYPCCIAFSPDGKTLVDGASRSGQPNGFEIWTVATGKKLVVLENTHYVGSLAFSPDGLTLFATEGDYNSLKMYSTGSYGLLSYFDQETDGIDTVAVSSNNRFIAYGCGYGTFAVAANPYYVAPAVQSLTLSSGSVVGGNSVTGTVTINAPALAGGVIALLSSSAPNAATPPATVTIPQGATSASFTIKTAPASSATSATITASIGSSMQSATLAIQSSVTALKGIAIKPASVLGGRNAVGTVTLTVPAPAGGTTVTLTNANPAVATVPTTVTVPAGATSRAFLIQTNAVSTLSTVGVTATYNGVSQTASLNVQPLTLLSVIATPSSIEGGLDGTLVVTLNGPAPQGGVVVTLTSSNAALASLPASVTIPAGCTATSVTIGTALVNANAKVTLTGAYNGRNQTTALTLTP